MTFDFKKRFPEFNPKTRVEKMICLNKLDYDEVLEHSQYFIDFFKVEPIKNLDKKLATILRKQKNKLDMSCWHGQNDCGTTHCRAGWYITMSGRPGALLEQVFSSRVAGALIFKASYPRRSVPDFYATNKEVLDELGVF